MGFKTFIDILAAFILPLRGEGGSDGVLQDWGRSALGTPLNPSWLGFEDKKPMPKEFYINLKISFVSELEYKLS